MSSSPNPPPRSARDVIDEAIRSDATPAVDVSSATTRELRASVELATGGTVADRVPFQLSPNARRWNEVREGAAGAHWSDAARATSALDYVILVTSAGAVGADVVLADGDASAPATRFAVGDAGTALLRTSYSIDPELHRRLANRQDAKPIDTSQF